MKTPEIVSACSAGNLCRHRRMLFAAWLVLAAVTFFNPPASAQIPQRNSLEAGSALVYARYTSDPANAAREDTSFKLTNLHANQPASVRLLFVDNSDGKAAEYTICIPAGETVTWRASDLDPGVTGYAIAVACDSLGRPMNFNWLTGQFQIGPKNSTELGWQCAATIARRSVEIESPMEGNAEMIFDGEMYDSLPAPLRALRLPGLESGDRCPCGKIV